MLCPSATPASRCEAQHAGRDTQRAVALQVVLRGGRAIGAVAPDYSLLDYDADTRCYLYCDTCLTSDAFSSDTAFAAVAAEKLSQGGQVPGATGGGPPWSVERHLVRGLSSILPHEGISHPTTISLLRQSDGSSLSSYGGGIVQVRSTDHQGAIPGHLIAVCQKAIVLNAPFQGRAGVVSHASTVWAGSDAVAHPLQGEMGRDERAPMQRRSLRSNGRAPQCSRSERLPPMPEASAEANGNDRGAGGAQLSAARDENGEHSHAEGVGERGSLDWYIRTLCHDNLTLSPAGLVGIVVVAATVGFGLSAWSRGR
jgi:hypothetical protein